MLLCKGGDRPLALGIMLVLVAVTAGLWWPWLAARLLYAPAAASLLTFISGDPILLEAIRDQNRRLAHVPEAVPPFSLPLRRPRQ